MALTFVSYGSSSHDLVHHTLPIPRWLSSCLLFAMEMLCLRSGRAYKVTHVHHHRSFPNNDDVEASAAGTNLRTTMLQGTFQQFRLWGWVWQHHPKDRLVLAVEAAWFLAFLAGSVCLLPTTPIPLVYAILVIGGSWTIPLITVYIPHD